MLRFATLFFAALFGFASAAGAWTQDGDYRFSDVDRVVAIGDVHGALEQLVEVLRKAEVIDEENRWIAGDDHLVSVGDLLDRGDDSRAVMDLLMRLQDEAVAAGGRVHVVLGNHEVMNLTGDLAYVTAGEYASYADVAPDPEPVEGVPAQPHGYTGHRLAFAPDGRYGRWLMELPFAVVVNGTLYLHAGVSGALADLSLEGLNERSHADLRRLMASRDRLVELGLMTHADDNGRAYEIATAIAEPPEAPVDAGEPTGDAEPVPAEHLAAAGEFIEAIDGLPFLPWGPLWIRRNAVCHPLLNQDIVDMQLAQLGAERLTIGHTPTLGRTIQSRFEGTLRLVDTGMNVGYYKGNPSALVLTGDEERPVYASLELDEVVAQSARHWERPYGMSDAEIEQFLREAEVVQVEDLDTGITKPQRLTLRLGDRELRAVYKNYDSDPDFSPSRWSTRRGNLADRYVYDVAAYHLDRILGLEMVPPAVIREVDGREGVVQYWLENAINERGRRQQEIPYRGQCSLANQYSLMNLFDALIHNDDRNLTNVLYTRGDWKLWLIDHSRAFRSHSRLPEFREDAPFRFTPRIRALLASIDAERLAPLRAYLHKRQIDGIVRRAERLARAGQ